MLRNFTVDEIKSLAEQERRMDRGEQPYVMHHGRRMAVIPEVMDELGLEVVQTISDAVNIAISQASIGLLES